MGFISIDTTAKPTGLSYIIPLKATWRNKKDIPHRMPYIKFN